MKTLSQFLHATNLKRGASKRTVDKYINQFKIQSDDLIADIYGYLGI
jgi:hypothetical protein